MIDRRFFLKVTGLVAAAGALQVWPVRAETRAGVAPMGEPSGEQWLPPGTYQVTGRVRLDAPRVEISGITNTQTISWSGRGLATPTTAGFSSYEHFDAPWRMPDIQVRGGRLEAVRAVPLDFA
jgi:hypothetical protein